MRRKEHGKCRARCREEIGHSRRREPRGLLISETEPQTPRHTGGPHNNSSNILSLDGHP
jgi:prepilin-type processing-associated H-X9-DG protein